MAFEVLEQRGLFRFRSATAVIDEFLLELRPRRESLRDLLHLSSAEAALIPMLADPRTFRIDRQRPIEVHREAARLALLETDCSPFDWQHEARNTPSVWDAAFFAADVSKMALLRPNPLEMIQDADEVVRFVYDLEDRYRQAGVGLARELADSGLVRVRGLLWHARVQVLLRPQTATERINGLMTRFELG